FPIIDLADRDLEGILGLNSRYGEHRRNQAEREAGEIGTFHLRFPLLGLTGLAAAFLGAAFLAAALAGRPALSLALSRQRARTSIGPAGTPPRFASRLSQYSHARLRVLGS